MSNERKIGDFVWFFEAGDYCNIYKGLIVNTYDNEKFTVTRVEPYADTKDFYYWDLFSEKEGLKLLRERLEDVIITYQTRLDETQNRLKELEKQNGT